MYPTSLRKATIIMQSWHPQVKLIFHLVMEAPLTEAHHDANNSNHDDNDDYDDNDRLSFHLVVSYIKTHFEVMFKF